MTTNPTIFILLRPSQYQELFSPESDQALRALGRLVFHDRETNLTSAQLAERISDFDAIITCWGTPRFTDDVLARASRLRLIIHSAGSIKQMLPEAVFARNIVVSHAAVAIAPAVAEMTMLLILLSLRQVHMLDRSLKAGEAWDALPHLRLGQELAGQRVGVVGAGYTGRCVIELLRAFKCEVWVYDPYLSAERAAELGVQKAEFADLLAQCPIVTLQAPPTRETHHMIGARELGLLQDGAIFVNTARSHLVDQAALLTELRTGRFYAALDVFDQEPLPTDSPFRQLSNVILTPHIAGGTHQARLRQGQIVAEELRRFVEGEPLRYRVTQTMLESMA